MASCIRQPIAPDAAGLTGIRRSQGVRKAIGCINSRWQNNSVITIRPHPEPRAAYRAFHPIGTRWSDNDMYGHVNNVAYYGWFDTAVNQWLIAQGGMDIHGGRVIGLVVETHCNYFAPLAFPEAVVAGIRVTHLGSSSVRYEVGIFADDAGKQGQLCAAKGHFVHVYVDRDTRRPTTLPSHLFKALETLT